MKKIRTAVIGAGHFGAYHLDKYADEAQSDLIAVVDAGTERAATMAGKYGVEALTDHRALFGRVDAVSIAVPTAAHFAVARDCLDAGIHVLIEKPMTVDLTEADQLIALAAARGLVLQVGHLERFTLAAAGIADRVDRPLYIECDRIAPFKPRSLDISVVYDVMIHDIDLILALVKSPLVSVDAVGAPVISPLEDIANTRLQFANGCVCNVTASRISGKSERKMRIFQRSGYLSIDFLARKVTEVLRPTDAGGSFEASEREYPQTDTVRAEIRAFLTAIANGTPPVISGEDGRRAIEAAARIDATLRAHRAQIEAQG